MCRGIALRNLVPCFSDPRIQINEIASALFRLVCSRGESCGIPYYGYQATDLDKFALSIFRKFLPISLTVAIVTVLLAANTSRTAPYKVVRLGGS